MPSIVMEDFQTVVIVTFPDASEPHLSALLFLVLEDKRDKVMKPW